MQRPCFHAMHRTICATVGVIVVIQVIPCMAQQSTDRSAFAKRVAGTAADFPASTGRFEMRKISERSGPTDLAASSTIGSGTSSGWRTCRECGYTGEGPKPFKVVDLRANFQPLGGTFSYHF
ncbi:MAG TPA: hypothetical protein VF503_11220 [Sphingobium sp.]|uniref:hypothetical protein n=1 Tax=Sphingobium sp. TaxID=1912891 RepID=UPI002ED295BE